MLASYNRWMMCLFYNTYVVIRMMIEGIVECSVLPYSLTVMIVHHYAFALA